MKIIVSHDVDHLRWREHWLRDAFIPKYAVRNTSLLCRGGLSASLWWRRMRAPFAAGPLHNLGALTRFDCEQGVPSTFFVGVGRGLGMSYGARGARPVVDWLRDQGFAVGVHGIAYAEAEAVRREHDTFGAFLPAGTPFGVRNHYLRRAPDTHACQAAAGYLFDSSEEALAAPYLRQGMVEFPVCLMDSRIVRGDRAGDGLAARRATEERLQEAERRRLPYFTLICHDVYYSPLFPVHRDWYDWMIPWLSARHPFSTFERAARALDEPPFRKERDPRD